jgi:hypothetical protein
MKLKTGKNCTKGLEKKIRNQKNKDQSKKTTHDKLELKGEFEKKKTKLQKLETKRTRIKSKSKTN